MHKILIVLAILGTTTVPAGAQTAPATNQAQTAKPEMVKKRVCQIIEDDDPYSRLGSNRKVCKTVEVPANPAADATKDGTASPAPEPH